LRTYIIIIIIYIVISFFLSYMFLCCHVGLSVKRNKLEVIRGQPVISMDGVTGALAIGYMHYDWLLSTA